MCVFGIKLWLARLCFRSVLNICTMAAMAAHFLYCRYGGCIRLVMLNELINIVLIPLYIYHNCINIQRKKYI